MIRHLMVAGICIGAILVPFPAFAASCANRDTVVERLKSRYSERLAGGGLQASKNAQTIVEVWASDETGTFTVILTTPEGLSCVVATGTEWFQTTSVAGPEGTES